MKLKLSLIVALCVTVSFSYAQKKKKNSKSKQAVIASIEKHKENLIKISDDIWELAETAFEEHESSKILADYAESQGMIVERGVAGMPTAFVATYGSGRPIISVLGEFDALPGLSQQTVPYKSPLNEGSAGHGCCAGPWPKD